VQQVGIKYIIFINILYFIAFIVLYYIILYLLYYIILYYIIYTAIKYVYIYIFIYVNIILLHSNYTILHLLQEYLTLLFASSKLGARYFRNNQKVSRGS